MPESLFDRVCAHATLSEAWAYVRAKGARGGVDGVSVDQFDAHQDEELARLEAELRSGRYVPEPPDRIHVPKSDGRTRPIGLPAVRDKVVQRAVVIVIEPLFERIFRDCSYAYRRNKGHRKAIGRTNHYLSQHNHWITTCDIHRFFDTLDHALLLSRVREQVHDPPILRLIELWLKMGVVHRGHYKDVSEGVTQGGVISPLLSNVYLHPFDMHMVEQKFNLVRYADDFIVLTQRKHHAQRAFETAQTFLNDMLRLRLNPVDPPVVHVDKGVVFLGIQFKGGSHTIAPAKLAKAEDKIRRIRGAGIPLKEMVEKLNEAIRSWQYYYGACDTTTSFAALEAAVVEGLTSAVTVQREKGRLKGQREVLGILKPLRFLHTAEEKARRLLRKRIAQGQAEKKTEPAKEARVTVKRAVSAQRRSYRRSESSQFDLAVGTRGSVLGVSGKLVVVRRKGKKIKEIPLSKVRHVLILEEGISLSSNLMYACAERGISMDLLNFAGAPVARLSTLSYPTMGVGLAQLRALDNGKAPHLACTFVKSKIRNQRNLLKYYHKYWKSADPAFARAFKQELDRMDTCVHEIERLTSEPSYETLRGQLFAIEGRAAAAYWHLVRLILGDRVPFERRIHKGADDLVNSLFNYGYGILYPRILGALLIEGLNPNISFLHKEQPGKPTLVYDFIEAFRAQVVDRAVISLLNKREHAVLEQGRLDRTTRANIVHAVLERLHTPLTFRGKGSSLEQVIRRQARDLARFLLEKGRYRPFVAKW